MARTLDYDEVIGLLEKNIAEYEEWRCFGDADVVRDIQKQIEELGEDA